MWRTFTFLLVPTLCMVLAAWPLGKQTTIAFAAETREEQIPAVSVLEGLGNLHHAITTQSDNAQVYFDQGLRLVYAFNHAEALRSFKEAARLDPGCAMAYWGQALALGPNINVAMSRAQGTEAYAAIQRALALKSRATEKESAYIEALATRYSNDDPISALAAGVCSRRVTLTNDPLQSVTLDCRGA